MPVLRWLVWFPVTVVPILTGMPFVYAGDVAEAIARCLEQAISIGNGLQRDGGGLERLAARRGVGTSWRRYAVVALAAAGADHPRLRSLRLPRASVGWKNRPLVEGLRETFALEAGGGSRRLTLATASSITCSSATSSRSSSAIRRSIRENVTSPRRSGPAGGRFEDFSGAALRNGARLSRGGRVRVISQT